MSKSDTDPTKQPNQKTEYDDMKMLELVQCIEDPMYFMKNFMMIQHPIKGSVKFVPYQYQEELIKTFHENRFTIALTGRQLGKTTCAAGFLLWKAMFVPDTTILIVANNYNGALEIMSRVRYAYENLPDHIRAGATEYNKGGVKFDNGSRIVSRAASPDAARGLSISLLYCLAGETTVQVRDKISGEIMTVTLETLYGLCDDEEVATGS